MSPSILSESTHPSLFFALFLGLLGPELRFSHSVTGSDGCCAMMVDGPTDAMVGPSRLSLHLRSGLLYAADYYEHRILVYDSTTGQCLSHFGSKGDGAGQFLFPRDVAVDLLNNRVIVCDTNNHRLQVFTEMEHQFLAVVGTRGDEPGNFNYPVAVAVSPRTGVVVVVDKGNHRVQVFNADLSLAFVFGDYGSPDARFRAPIGVALQSSGNIVVTEQWGHRFQIFSPSGTHLRTIGTMGNSDAQFQMPEAVCVDERDKIIVADHSNNRLQVFAPSGDFLCAHRENVVDPVGVTLTADGQLILSQWRTGALRVFQTC